MIDTSNEHEDTLIPNMVTISSGTIPTVSTTGFRPDYSGQHVDTFEIGKHVITMAEWIDMMDYLPKDTEQLSLNHPVINVNWFDVHRYIERLNKLTDKEYRLPTEIEWEYAARAGTLNDYHVPREMVLDGKVINYDKNKQGSVAVASLPPNKWGCYEMLGNVWEWVSDSGRTVVGFEGDDDSELKILRGGCWASSEFEVKLTARDEHEKGTNGWNSFGFRIARTAI